MENVAELHILTNSRGFVSYYGIKEISRAYVQRNY